MFKKMRVVAIVGAVLPLLYLTGCGGSKVEPSRAGKTDPVQESTKVAKQNDEHAHKAAAHGGLLIAIGQDNYHAEAIFAKGGEIRLHILGRDEAKVQEVEKQSLSAHVTAAGDTESTPITLEAAPQAGDAGGKTSQFIGKLPKELQGKSVTVTASITISGERFRFSFANTAAANAHDETEMPGKVADDEEKELYLKPGGAYTEADIRANGNITASEKFKGLKSTHNTKARTGDKICPISETKANEKFSWIVNGKKYEFCCPPCVDEFVKTAKENPGKILEPSAYVKK